MDSPKHTILLAVGTALGFAVLLLFWISWNYSIEEITTDGFLSAGSFVISTILFLVLALVLLGMLALFAGGEKLRIGVYMLWGVTALIAPSPVGVLWKLLLAASLFSLCLLCDYAIQRRIALLVKPVLTLIFPTFFKLWLFGLSVLLAVHMVVHPAIAIQEVDVSIPEGMWQQVWELFGIGLDAEQGGVEIQNALEDTQVPLSIDQELNEQEVTMLEEMLAEYGISFPDLAGFLETVGRTEDGSLDLSQASEGINTVVSDAAKNQTESIFSTVLEPIKPFWPLIVALSFFLSVQIFVPIFVYLGLLCLKLSIYLLTICNIVRLSEEDAVISRYVLK